MSEEDFKRIEEIAEDAGFRVIGVVAFMLGNFWTGVIFFLVLPIGVRQLKKFFTQRRLEKGLAQ